MPKLFSGKQDVYLEIAQRYENYIRLGVLQDGDKLPSVRTAAQELGVNPNTVQKAYCRLEELGLIRSLPKKGAFVTFALSAPQDASERHTEIRRTLQALKDAGIGQTEMIEILKEVYEND